MKRVLKPKKPFNYDWNKRSIRDDDEISYETFFIYTEILKGTKDEIKAALKDVYAEFQNEDDLEKFQDELYILTSITEMLDYEVKMKEYLSYKSHLISKQLSLLSNR